MKINPIKYNYYSLSSTKPAFHGHEWDEIPDEKLDTKTLMQDIALEMQALQRKFEILQKRVNNDVDFSSGEFKINPLDKRLDDVTVVPGMKKAFAFSAVLSDKDCNPKHVKRIMEHLDSIKPKEHQLILIEKIINHSKEKKDKKSLSLLSNYCGKLADKYRYVNGQTQRPIPLSTYKSIYKTALEINSLESISDDCFNLYNLEEQNEIMSFALKTKNTSWIENNLHLFKDDNEKCLMEYMDICLEEDQGMDLELVYENVHKNENSFYKHDKKFLNEIKDKLDKYKPVDTKEKKLYKKLQENILLKINNYKK